MSPQDLRGLRAAGRMRRATPGMATPIPQSQRNDRVMPSLSYRVNG
jgi:hypothetical protein